MNTMRVANPNPPFCSACFNQQPEKIHVDMEVAFDGPCLNTPSATEVAIKQVIDDLYLCEDCLISAYKLLDIDGEQSHIENLMVQIEFLETRNRMMAERLNAVVELVQPPRPVTAQ